MKIYPDFSEITQIKMCLSSINHEDEYISLLYINIKYNRRMYTSLCIARVFDDHRSWQKLINYITNIKAKSKPLDPENSSPKAAVHTKLL